MATSIVVCALAAACAPPASPVRVGVVFGDNWTLGPIVLTGAEQARIKETALATLRDAFAGFAVEFDERADRDRLIRVERNLMRAGATPIGSKVSTVSLDGINLTLLAVVGCRDIASCGTKTRAELVDALGRGIGATAAHELGHQAGFRFSRDPNCADCYDGWSATNRTHFFGEKHWSPEALAIMRRVLPLTHQTHAAHWPTSEIERRARRARRAGFFFAASAVSAFNFSFGGYSDTLLG